MKVAAVTLSHRLIHSSRVLNYCHCAKQRPFLLSGQVSSNMKRKATESGPGSKTKRQREPEADYCDVATQKDEYGSPIWPAPAEAIEKARAFLTEWYVNLSHTV